jgi:hypothetical protein
MPATHMQRPRVQAPTALDDDGQYICTLCLQSRCVHLCAGCRCALQALSDELETHTKAAEAESAGMGDQDDDDDRDDLEEAAAGGNNAAGATPGPCAGHAPAPRPRPAHDALQASKAALVQFHGELVLLLHWSLLNYAAVVKILKKHDKRTGVLLRAPYLANVLQQPFSSTTIMSRLAKRAEELVVHSSQPREAPADALAEPLVASGAGAGGAPQQQPTESAAAAVGPASHQHQQAQPQPAASSAATPPGVTASDSSTFTAPVLQLALDPATHTAGAGAGAAGSSAHTADDAAAGAGPSGRQAPLVG